MRICISSRPLDTFGGAERVVVSDAEHFARAGHEVHLIAPEFDQDVLSSYGLSELVETHRLSTTQYGSLPMTFSRAYGIRRLLQTLEPDAVFAHYKEKATWLALATLDIDPLFATHVHGSLFWFQNDTKRCIHMWKECAQRQVAEVPGHSEFWTVGNIPAVQRIRNLGEEFLEAMALRSCDDVFVNTNQVAQELNCLYGVDATVNPPGIDEEQTSGPVDMDPPVEGPFVFSLSRLDPRKRIDLLIRAFAEFRERRPKFQLVIGGTGAQEESLKRLATEVGVSDAVTFTGHVEESLLPTYYSEADIFTCPGWMSYGLTPLEAARFGTKVAISTDAFVKEILGDQPGVRVLDPDVDAWATGLDELADCDGRPSPDILPTVEEHVGEKLAALNT